MSRPLRLIVMLRRKRFSSAMPLLIFGGNYIAITDLDLVFSKNFSVMDLNEQFNDWFMNSLFDLNSLLMIFFRLSSSRLRHSESSPQSPKINRKQRRNSNCSFESISEETHLESPPQQVAVPTCARLLRGARPSTGWGGGDTGRREIRECTLIF